MARHMLRPYNRFYFETDTQIARHMDTIRAHLVMSQRIEPWMVLVLEEASRRLYAIGGLEDANANDNAKATDS